jgi:DNA-binding GntR family transcriptional regulator
VAKRAFSHNGSNHSATGITDGMPARTLIEGAYVRLRDDIVEGRLAPGAKLRIAHLKSSYCVGAGTLREAITRLAGDALIISEGQRGFWVAPISIQDLEDLTRLRMHIEIEALRQSIRAADPQWREQVRVAYQQMSAVEQPIKPEQRKQWDALNTQFHEALVSGFNSPWTLRVLRILSRQSERYRYLAIHLPNTGRDVHAEHSLIFEAAMAGAESRAALALEMHIRATPDLIVRACGDGTLPSSVAAPGSAPAQPQPDNGSRSHSTGREAIRTPRIA